MVERGAVWLAALDPTVGSEIQKTQPWLIISPMEMHDHLRKVIVAPMTPGCRPAGFRVRVTFQGVSGLVLLEQSVHSTSNGSSRGSAPSPTAF